MNFHENMKPRCEKTSYLLHGAFTLHKTSPSQQIMGFGVEECITFQVWCPTQGALQKFPEDNGKLLMVVGILKHIIPILAP
jgi:hypothetical protein